ncbi:MAG: cell division topological specificity factor MinE [Gomphosphaeria aponina SAG 52.96 = DSM 107014]|uniref:Cell division topological specificity factor n=1 Tax=Gomphosphaeria aponina SAG 52.96 = DSM 107014 TaxID=1521640 RepID=A0A941GSI1_9CHRO|nr:cell division topological specificity factor MinE [Gomphosphaeria aponina SAG 52.96 = DSM 107014]
MNELIERLFNWSNTNSSRDEAKRRLKLVIAHDRAGISPEMIESMRQEILEVIARYLEIDQDETEFTLESDQRITALYANFPIRKVKRQKLLVRDEESETTKT